MAQQDQGIRRGLPMMIMLMLASLLTMADPQSPTASSLLSSKDRKLIDTYLPGVLVEPMDDNSKVESIDDWWPQIPARYEMTRTGGTGGGEKKNFTSVYAQSPLTSDDQAKPPKHEWKITLREKVSKYFYRNNHGMHAQRVTDHEAGYITLFDPTEPVLVLNTKAGDTIQKELKLRVSKITHPDVLAHDGSLTCTYRDLGSWKARVPAGDFEARLIHVKYEGSVSLAHLEFNHFLLLGRKTGPIAWINLDTQRVLFSDTDDYGCVLTSRQQEESPPARTKPSRKEMSQ